MDGTNELKETTRVTAPVASNTLSVNVFAHYPKYKGSNCR
jgi:hypothetical protein